MSGMHIDAPAGAEGEVDMYTQPGRLREMPGDVPATVDVLQKAVAKVQRRDDRDIFKHPITEAQVRTCCCWMKAEMWMWLTDTDATWIWLTTTLSGRPFELNE